MGVNSCVTVSNKQLHNSYGNMVIAISGYTISCHFWPPLFIYNETPLYINT